MAVNNYTEADLLSLNNHSVVAFYNGVLVGVLQQGDHTISMELDTDDITASLHGSSSIAQIKKGVEVSITLAVEGTNKHRMANVFSGTYQTISGGTATADTTPDVGSMEILGNPLVMARNALVIYPIYIDSAGTAFIDNTNNKNTFLFPKATAVNGFELTLSTEDIIKFDLEFRANVDVTNDGRMAIHDDGIADDGTYTPA